MAPAWHAPLAIGPVFLDDASDPAGLTTLHPKPRARYLADTLASRTEAEIGQE